MADLIVIGVMLWFWWVVHDTPGEWDIVPRATITLVLYHVAVPYFQIQDSVALWAMRVAAFLFFMWLEYVPRYRWAKRLYLTLFDRTETPPRW